MSQIHKYKYKNLYIVIDPCSGAVHAVDKETYEVLDTAEPPFGGEGEVLAELRALYNDGLLYSADDYRRYAARYSGDVPIKALCLHVAHDCNLRCRYCFAQTGDFGGGDSGRCVMPVDVGLKAIDFLIEKSGDRQFLEVDFFGGEPLLAWETVVAVVTYARKSEQVYSKKFRFTITTNGIALDRDKIDFINREMSNCVLSLDGRRAVNDYMRPTANGKGSYDVIVPKFKQLAAGRKNPGRTDYYLRGTFTAENLDFSEDVKAIANEGFKHISVEPVTADPKLDYAIKPEQVDSIKAEYERLSDWLDENTDVHFFHFNVDLNQGPCAIKRLRGCGAGTEYAAVTPEGDVYPCHQYVGLREWRMGSIFDGLLDQNIKEYFGATHIYSKEACVGCWARFYCSGGCNANSFLRTGDARKQEPVSCELMKKRLEIAIARQVLHGL